MKQNAPIIIKLGGSLMVPDDIDVRFLKQFKKQILSLVKKGYRFIIVTGGGSTSRSYATAAKTLGVVTNDDLDWLGIHTTRINGHLLRTIFRKESHPVVLHAPRGTRVTKPIAIAAGWRPGWSTDYVAARLARYYKVKTIINLSNISYVYTADPKKDRTARPLSRITWKEYRKLIAKKWTPSGNFPIDPVAAALEQKLGITVYMLSGKQLSLLENSIKGFFSAGTVITGK